MRAVLLEKIGSPDEAFRYTEEYPAPSEESLGPNDVLIDVVYASINFIDTYHRTGLYPVQLPAVIGRDGAGFVRKVGSNVQHVQPGDRVAFVMVAGYAAQTVAPSSRVVKIPDGIKLSDATCAMIQGLTAHYLIRDTYRTQPGDTVLIHAGAGGTGQLLIQMAKAIGAKVITTVSTDAKAEIVRKLGADHVINYTEKPDFAAEVNAITQGQGVRAAYDGIGKTTWQGSLSSLGRRGTLVLFGNASGPVPPIDPLLLSKHKSAYVTRPTLGDYIVTREELEARAQEIFSWIREGKVHVAIDSVLPLEKVPEAHKLLESRGAVGKILILVDPARADHK